MQGMIVKSSHHPPEPQTQTPSNPVATYQRGLGANCHSDMFLHIGKSLRALGQSRVQAKAFVHSIKRIHSQGTDKSSMATTGNVAHASANASAISGKRTIRGVVFDMVMNRTFCCCASDCHQPTGRHAQPTIDSPTDLAVSRMGH